MKTITVNQASQNLLKHINYSLKDHEEISIASENGAVVMISQTDYEAMKETLKLLSDKKSLRALVDSHYERDMGNEPESYSVEEVFSDI